MVVKPKDDSHDGVLVQDGTLVWYNECGLIHRNGNPAVIYYDGDQEWWVNDLCHRIDGPAVIYAKGGYEWWINGREITNEVAQWMEDREVTWPWDDATQVEFLLTWA